MPIYKWRRKPTKHFGEVSVPFAQIGLQGADGTFRMVATQVDSGATVSLLRRSTADLLGIELESGRRVDMGGVGSGRIVAYVHEIPTRFEEKWPPIPVPFAIATVETVPNLLGRLRVFEQLQVDFDPSLSETRITARWLDDGDRRILDWLAEVQSHVYERLPRLGWSQPSREAIRRMLNRADMILASVAGLAKLHRTNAIPLLIRALFEVSAQFQYLMQDRDSRSQLYLDYEHIARKERIDAFLAGPGPIVDRLRKSPRKSAGMSQVNREYARVEAQFKNASNKNHKNWYRMQFLQLVQKLDHANYDWSAEHEIWYRMYSGWVHADPFATLFDRPDGGFTARECLFQCYAYIARMLIRIADDGAIILTSEQDSGLRHVARGF